MASPNVHAPRLVVIATGMFPGDRYLSARQGGVGGRGHCLSAVWSLPAFGVVYTQQYFMRRYSNFIRPATEGRLPRGLMYRLSR